MSSFNLTHDGLTIQVARVTLDPKDIRIMGHGRLIRLAAKGDAAALAEVARRDAAQDRCLATMGRA